MCRSGPSSYEKARSSAAVTTVVKIDRDPLAHAEIAGSSATQRPRHGGLAVDRLHDLRDLGALRHVCGCPGQ